MSMQEVTRDEVPTVVRGVFDIVASLVDKYCGHSLTEDYRLLARRLLGRLARKRPSPLFRGRVETWACGVIYAIGVVNFLFDVHQRPHVRAQDLCSSFGIGSTTGSAKAREIMKMFRMVPLDPDWCTPQKLVDNPLVQLRDVVAYLGRTGAAREERASQAAAERAFWGRGTA